MHTIESKFWHGKLDYFSFMISTLEKNKLIPVPTEIEVKFEYLQKAISVKILRDIVGKTDLSAAVTNNLREFLISSNYLDSPMADYLSKVCIYDFSPFDLSNASLPTGNIERTGQGITYALADILFSNRKSFDELEDRLRILVPNIQSISLQRAFVRSSSRNNQIDNNQSVSYQSFSLELIDKYSGHRIPASDISDGTLRILAFLTALYQQDTPSIICFEEIENGVHPWLLHKMMELLKLVSTEGITGKPVQVLITTHSPVLLNYVEPHQVRAVELDNEGKTQVHNLPTDSVRFQKALEAYDGSLGELWFTNQFGGNPA